MAKVFTSMPENLAPQVPKIPGLHSWLVYSKVPVLPGNMQHVYLPTNLAQHDCCCHCCS